MNLNIKSIITILFISFFASSCILFSQIRQFHYTYLLPVNAYKENQEIKIFSINDTISIFQFRNLIFYKLPPIMDLETNLNLHGSETFLLTKKNDSIGIYFSSIRDSSSGKKVSLDSILKVKALKSLDVSIPSDTLWTKSNEIPHPNRKELIQCFSLIKEDINHKMYDSIYYYYTKSFNTFNFSFSPKLDSITGLKLYKIRGVINAYYSKEQGFEIPTSELKIQFLSKKIENDAEIKKLIHRFYKQAYIN